MRRGSRLALVAVALAALCGCGSTTDDRPAKWSFISAAITEQSCATVNCHSALGLKGGVDLHDRASGYTSLTTHNFVYPGDTTHSSPILLLMKAVGSQRMPPDVPLPNADIDLIDQWIQAGAPNN